MIQDKVGHESVGFSIYVYAAGISINTMNQMNDILQHPIYLWSQIRDHQLCRHAHLPLHCSEVRLSKSWSALLTYCILFFPLLNSSSNTQYFHTHVYLRLIIILVSIWLLNRFFSKINTGCWVYNYDKQCNNRDRLPPLF